jgi:peptidylprolyl isomerase
VAAESSFSRDLFVFGILATLALSGCAAQKPKPSSGATVDCRSSATLKVDADGLSLESVTIKTDVGTIRFRFYPLDAPCTVARIRTLVRQGFYNGLVFHRVVPGFVIQGGDPKGNGSGGSGTKLAAEFNKRLHIKGAVAMARTQDPNSADSQFYIALGTLQSLDGQYTVFGQVVEGLDVLDHVTVGTVMRSVALEP